MRALKIAATGMTAQQMRVETISQNLANMSTTGYNARRAEFADLHYQQYARAGAVSASDGTVLPTGVQLGLGVRPAAVSVQLEQGALSATRSDLDVAIDGKGQTPIDSDLVPGPTVMAARIDKSTECFWPRSVQSLQATRNVLTKLGHS